MPQVTTVAAARLRQQLLQIIAKQQEDPDTVAMALSDILGLTAARLDQVLGTQSLDGKIDVMVERVRETYARSYDEMRRPSLIRWIG